jgi:hypothetical protein
MRRHWSELSWLLPSWLVASAVVAFDQTGIFIAAAILGAVYLIRGHRKMWQGFLSVAVILFLLSMLPPSVCDPGPRRRVRMCGQRLHEIALALRTYHERFGSFPPQYTTDKNGRPMHSWRTLILPFLEGMDDRKKYHFDEPWDGPNNSKLTDPAAYYQCWLDHQGWAGVPMAHTNYVAVIGPQTAWRGEKPVRLADLPDHGRDTVLLVEMSNSRIDWRQPLDLTFDQATAGINREPGPGISSQHVLESFFYRPVTGVNVAFADGCVVFVPADTPPQCLRSLLAGNPVEGIENSDHTDFDRLLHARPDWRRILAFASLAISSIVFLFRPRARSRQTELASGAA